MASRSFATTYNLKSTSQNPSETDGPEHPAENDLAALKSGSRPGHCRISEGRKLGILATGAAYLGLERGDHLLGLNL